MFVMFHQGGGRARVYLCPGLSGRHRFSGRQGTEQFLAACRLSCVPVERAGGGGNPAGPCATYPGDDTWTDAPYTDGVVLIGDAAATTTRSSGKVSRSRMRDARIVRDLVLDGARDSAAFARYG